MPTERRIARNKVRMDGSSINSNYGLLNDMAMIIPPAPDEGDNTTNAPTEHSRTDTPIAPDTITETSAVVTETTVAASEPKTAEIQTAHLDKGSIDGTNSENSANVPNQTENTPNTNLQNLGNYMTLDVPTNVEYLDKNFLLNNIINNNELCFIKLKNLCETYFNHKRLIQLGNLKYGTDFDNNGIKNANFFICIGKKAGYDSVLKKPFNTKSDKNKTLYIKESPDYQKLFVTFLHVMFTQDNLDILNETYMAEDILTVSLFYREATKTPKASKLKVTDHLIGVASIVIDDEPSCLLVWLGILEAFPCKKPNVSFKDKLDKMRGALNIGTFMVCTVQWIKSLLVGSWIPITCQIFERAKGGPLNFYKKSYFIRLNRDHALIHMQYLKNRSHIIDDDPTLQWYALFHPLQYLTMFEINSIPDAITIEFIFARAKYFFLMQKMYPYSCHKMLIFFQQLFGKEFDENTVISTTKTLPDMEKADEDESEWIRFVTDENQETKEVLPSSKVLDFLFEANENIKLKRMNFYYAENNVNPAGYIFLLTSKLMFGSASYHYIIRQFYYFIYKSLAKLKTTHNFCKEVMPTLVELIIKRTYLNPGYGFQELRIINGLPIQVQDMRDNKTGQILKMYYEPLLNLYAESFLKSKFQGDESDLFFLKEIFNVSISIINVTTNDVTPFAANYLRNYKIEVDQSTAVPFDTYEYVYEFIKYIKKIPNIMFALVKKTYWLTRINANEIYIMTTSDDDDEERILRLPSSIGGAQLLTVDETEVDDLFSSHTEEVIAIQKFDKKLDLIIERVEQESQEDNQMKVYRRYIQDRKWKNYSKLFAKVAGGKLRDNDPDNLAIGPLYDIEEIVNARIDHDFIMPIYRLLDPWKEVFRSKTLAIQDKMDYDEILTFRKETFLSDRVIECFIDILNDPSMGFSLKTWVLSTYQLQWVIRSQQSTRHFVNKLPLECSKILIVLCIDEHFYIVEIRIPSKLSTEVTVLIADSKGEDMSLDDLTEEVLSANVDVLAAAFNPYLPINYIKANDVVEQKNDYDCGVCSSQRVFFCKRFDNPIELPQDWDYLKDTVTFRIFMMAEILKYYRQRLSSLVYCPRLQNQEANKKLLLTDSQEQDQNASAKILNENPEEEKLSTSPLNSDVTNIQIKDYQEQGLDYSSTKQLGSTENVERILPKPTGRKSVGGKALLLNAGSDDGSTKEGSDGSSTDTETKQNEGEDENEGKNNEDADADDRNKDNEDGDEDDDEDGDDDETDREDNEDANADIPSLENEANEDGDDENGDEDDGEDADSDIESSENENDEDGDEDDGSDSDYKAVADPKDKRKVSSDSDEEQIPRKKIRKKKLSPKQIARSQKLRSSSSKKKPAKTVTVTKKKQLYGRKRIKTKQKSNPTTIEEQEEVREKKLAAIRNEIQRWETWTDVLANTVEIDLFSNDPNYFINQKVPQEVQRELNNDINRIKTKMYEPIQYDYQRSKRAAEEEFGQILGAAMERHSKACNELTNITDEKSTQYKNKQKEVLMLLERKNFLIYSRDTVAELLPYNAVYGIRTKQNENKKEYYVIAQLPNGSLKEKLVTRSWIEKHVERDYLNRFYQAEDERGWILFTQEDANNKLVKDTDDLRKLLRDNRVKPVYQYKINKDDDRIHCVRVAVTFKHSYKRMEPNSINWAIMTEKHSSNKESNKSPNPWVNTDENGQKCHTYWDCKETLLQAALGELCFNLIMSAVQQTWKAEYRHQGHPYLKPRFHFDNTPHIEFIPNSERFIDPFDLNKASFLKQRSPVFHPDYCGIFSNCQYYYFDMREMPNQYFVNVSTRQISGIYYNPTVKKFIGLEKFRERGRQKYKKVELDTAWVTKNIDKKVIDAAKDQVGIDQRRFIKLPVGLGRPLQTLQKLRKNPTIVYPQYGEDTCVFSSLSSALFYLKYEDVALAIDDYKTKIMMDSFENLMGKITEYIHGDEYFKLFRKKCDIKKITHCSKFDLIKQGQKKENILFHVVLISQDGGENHAICVVNNYIFDGNFSNALPLEQEYLNKSCDSVFLGIASGYKYIFSN
jgi:hypothetical protein